MCPRRRTNLPIGAFLAAEQTDGLAHLTSQRGVRCDLEALLKVTGGQYVLPPCRENEFNANALGFALSRVDDYPTGRFQSLRMPFVRLGCDCDHTVISVV